MRCSVCLVIMFCSKATHKLFQFNKAVAKAQRFFRMFGTLQSRHSLTASQQSLISVLLPLSLSWAWAVLASVFWQWLDTSCPLGCLPISLLAPDLISRLRLRPGQSWCQWWAGSEDAGESHTTTHLTAHPTICLCHKRGWGETPACNKFIREDWLCVC